MMKRQGFTIVECLVAVAIVCVLASLFIPAFHTVKTQTSQREAAEARIAAATVAGADTARFLIVTEAQPISEYVTITVLQDKDTGMQYALIKYAGQGVTMSPLGGR